MPTSESELINLIVEMLIESDARLMALESETKTNTLTMCAIDSAAFDAAHRISLDACRTIAKSRLFDQLRARGLDGLDIQFPTESIS